MSRLRVISTPMKTPSLPLGRDPYHQFFLTELVLVILYKFSSDV